jgi:lysyl-tRNA synthetase class 2
MSRARVLAPSDLASKRGAPARAGVVTVGGRVAESGPRRIVLADAFAAIVVEGRAFSCEPGDLVVVSGRLRRGRLEDARMTERTACPTPRAGGAVERFQWQGAGGRLQARARALEVVREVFRERGFIEVETPFRVRAPGVDAHVDALRAEGGFLVTSPELHLKRLLVGGFPRVVEVSRVSRLGERGTLHEPEFTLLEWYRAFAGQQEIQGDTEAVVERVARALRGRPELVLPSGRVVRVKPPFARLSVREAFRRWTGVRDASELAARDKDRYFELLVGRVEPKLAELPKPVFLCDYPITEAALARPSPEDPSVAERFELYVGGVELSNGYGELTDPVEQKRRFEAERRARKAEGRRTYPLDVRFLEALREGMPRSGGNALGLDRLIMLALGAKSVSDVIAFPDGL